MFRALIEAINEEDHAYAEEYHGTKGHVKHLLQYMHGTPTERCCEIADTLLLFFDDKDDIRYTFLQNKRDYKTLYNADAPLQRMKGAPVQWDLLHYRCKLSDSLYTNLPEDCLSAAELNSAATYGVFVNEKASQDVDMTYHIARDLTPVTPSPISSEPRARTYAVGTAYNHLHFVNGYWEIEGTPTLDDFEAAAQAMFAGSPLRPNDLRHRELTRVLLSFALTRLQYRGKNRRYNEENSQKRHSFLDRLAQCAHRYELDLRETVQLPYNLVLFRAKDKILFSDRDEKDMRTENGFTPIHNTAALRNRCENGDPIFIDGGTRIDSDLEAYLVCNDCPAYIMEPQDDGYLLIQAYDYFVHKKRAPVQG